MFCVERDRVLKEFAEFYSGNVEIKPIIVDNILSFTLEADLCFNGEVVKHYPLADLALLDLNDLMLKRMIEAGYTADK